MASTYKLHRTQLLQSNEMYCIHSESIHSESPCLTDHALGNLLVGQANLFVAGGARPHDVTVIAGRGGGGGGVIGGRVARVQNHSSSGLQRS